VITMTNISRQAVDASFALPSELRSGAQSRRSVRRLAGLALPLEGRSASAAGYDVRFRAPRTAVLSHPTTQRPVPGATAWSPPVL
jgi:hypothetical protein